MRSSSIAIMGLLLVGACVAASVVALGSGGAASRSLDCGQFVAAPNEGWVRLEGCVLDFGAALLVDGAGRFERLDDRLEGLWRQLPEGEVRWAQVLVPVQPREQRAQPVRLVVALTDADLLAWVNALEQTSGQARAQVLRRRAVVDRLTAPGQLIVQVTREAGGEAVQRFLLHPGTPPQAEVPGWAVLLGGLGAAALLWALARRGAPVSRSAPGAPPIDLSGVKVELGELEALRSEERRPGDS